MLLSIVIPAFNEEARIGPTLKAIQRFLRKEHLAAEIIVVNDGSRDKTAEIVRSLTDVQLIDSAKNEGKGAAVKRGMLASKGKYVLFTDADLSTPIEELGKMLPCMETFDIVIGARTDESKIVKRQPLYRVFMGKMFNRIVRLMSLSDFMDTQCGFKLFHGDVARRIFALQRISRWTFDVEILLIAKHLGYRIKEHPVAWSNSAATTVKNTDAIKMFVELIKIRLNIARGLYG